MRFEKEQLVNDMKQFLESSDNIFVVGYKGLRVADFNDLRQRLSETGAECHVVPNILFQKAVSETQFKNVAEDSILTGDNAIVAGDDAVNVAKVLRDFSDEYSGLTLKAGSLEGRFLNSSKVLDLASLPPRQELLGQLVGVLQAPSRDFVSLLSRKTATVVYALQAYIDKQENQQ